MAKKHHSVSCQDQACKLVTEEGLKQVDAAKQLWIHPVTVRKWLAKRGLVTPVEVVELDCATSADTAVRFDCAQGEHLRVLGWRWLTRLKSNRRVNPDLSGLRAVSACDVAAAGTVVQLEGYGLVPFDCAQGEVFRIGARDGTADHWATDDLTMDDLGRLRLAEASWKIEEYHRGLKQVTNIERCQCTVGRAQRGHIGLALRAFVIVERYCDRTGVNWLTAKWQITWEAVRAYRANPIYRLGTAQVLIDSPHRG